MTQLINAFTAEGYGGQFISLLEDWGRYSRYFGCSGFAGGKTPALPRFIDDASAEEIDSAMLTLKRDRPQLWQLIKMRYIQGLDAADIAAIMRKGKKRPKGRPGVTRGSNSYRVRVAELGTLMHADEKTVAALLDLASKLVFNLLENRG